MGARRRSRRRRRGGSLACGRASPRRPRAGRDPAAVQLIVVTKTFDAEVIVPVLEAGHRVFGENRVQEAKAKWPALRARFPTSRCT